MSISVTRGAHKITLRNYTTGPKHDPYGGEVILVEPSREVPLSQDNAAVWDSNGLGLSELRLLQGGRVVRVVRSLGGSKAHERCHRTKVRLLAKRWTGLDLDEATEILFEAERRMETDPMGPLSSYI